MIWTRLVRDEGGATYTIEILLVATLVVLGSAVGLARLRVAIASEANDLANAVGSLNQSFIVPSADVCACKLFTAGSGFLDQPDECDCSNVDICGEVKDHNGTVVKAIIEFSQG